MSEYKFEGAIGSIEEYELLNKEEKVESKVLPVEDDVKDDVDKPKTKGNSLAISFVFGAALGGIAVHLLHYHLDHLPKEHLYHEACKGIGSKLLRYDTDTVTCKNKFQVSVVNIKAGSVKEVKDSK